jgi:HK97 family phage portal protein
VRTGILASLFERRGDVLDESTASALIQSARSLYTYVSDAGITVTPVTALENTVVWSAVTLLSTTVATLPLIVYRRLKPKGRMQAPEHYLYPLLHDIPNPEMTAADFREALMGHLLLWGNAYAEIAYDGRGRITALWPLRPDAMEMRRDRLGQLWYLYHLPSHVNERPQALRADQIWHLHGFSQNGLLGVDPMRMARQAIGLAKATETFGARFFGNGSQPGGVLQIDGKLTKDAAERLAASWEAAHSGLSNAQRVAVLENGVKWQQIGVEPEKAQFLLTRQHQREEIAGFFHVPPHLIGDLSRSTNNNIEHQGIEFVVYSLRPWMVKIEQSITRDLFLAGERSTYYAEHLVDALLRGDLAARTAYYVAGRQNGWLNADDIRESENQNPVPGGDIYLVNGNMIPAGQAGTPAPAAPTGRSLLPLTGFEGRVRSVAGSSEARRAIAQSYRGLIVDSAQRILRREQADVMRQAEKVLGARDAGGFMDWLHQFYAQHPEYITRQWLPVFRSLGQQINRDAAAQIGSLGMPPEVLDAFVANYVGTAASRYTWSSYNQLRAVIEGANNKQADPLAAMRERFAEWLDTRPEKLAVTHTVRANNAFSRETWVHGGVERFAWNTHGTNCPYCNALRGRVAGVKDVFLKADEPFKPEGAETQLVPRGHIRHAPAHYSCDCSVEPS